ncbi:MAG: hypothetical protein IJV07_00180 [Alphaproteobacteria bacterium]|nr:hypothetical protein [Alphaproteobacteria bacterium]
MARLTEIDILIEKVQQLVQTNPIWREYYQTWKQSIGQLAPGSKKEISLFVNTITKQIKNFVDSLEVTTTGVEAGTGKPLEFVNIFAKAIKEHSQQAIDNALKKQEFVRDEIHLMQEMNQSDLAIRHRILSVLDMKPEQIQFERKKQMAQYAYLHYYRMWKEKHSFQRSE